MSFTYLSDYAAFLLYNPTEEESFAIENNGRITSISSIQLPYPAIVENNVEPSQFIKLLHSIATFKDHTNQSSRDLFPPLLNAAHKRTLITLIDSYTTDISVFKSLVLEIEDLFSFSSHTQSSVIEEKEFVPKEEEFVRLIINNIPDGITVFNKDLNITFWSKSLETRTGLKKETVLGKNLFTSFPSYEKVLPRRFYLEALEGQTQKLSAVPYLHREGFFDIDIYPLQKSSGEIVGGVTISRDVSQSKHAEQLIKEQNKYLQELNHQLEKEKGFSRALLRSQINGIISLDEDLCFTEWNSVMEKLVGRKRSDIIGKTVLQAFPEKEGTPWYNAVKEAAKGNSICLMGILSENKSFYYDAYIMPLMENDEKKANGVVGLFIDVTQKKEAEERLTQREHFLEKVTNTSPGIIGIYNINTGEYSYINQAVSSILGYDPQEVITKGISFLASLVHPDDVDRINNENQKAILELNENIPGSENKLQIFEYRIRHKSGTWRWLKTYGTVFSRDGENKVEAVLNISVDITERKKNEFEIGEKNKELAYTLKELRAAEEKLKEVNNKLEKRVEERTKELAQSEEELKKTLERTIQLNLHNLQRENFLSEIIRQTPVATAITDSEGFFIQINPACQELFGFPGNDHSWKKYNILSDKTIEKKSYYRDLYSVFQDGRIAKYTSKYTTRDITPIGQKAVKTIFLQITVFPIKDAKDRVTNAVIQYEDITERREAEEALIKNEEQLKVFNEELLSKNQQLLRINDDLDNFIYTASHDLKSPIVNIEGLIDALKRTVMNKLDDREKTILQMMDTSALKLKNTIGYLANVSKEIKNIDEAVESISFREIMESVKFDIAAPIKESKAEIVENFEVKEITFIKTNLNSILQNLLTNAIKYKSPERKLKIEVSTKLKNQFVILSVKDNGLGMRKDQTSKLFNLFRRIHTHVEGTGVGLYIVKRITENAGGKVSVESEPDEGSTFNVYLPINL